MRLVPEAKIARTFLLEDCQYSFVASQLSLLSSYSRDYQRRLQLLTLILFLLLLALKFQDQVLHFPMFLLQRLQEKNQSFYRSVHSGLNCTTLSPHTHTQRWLGSLGDESSYLLCSSESGSNVRVQRNVQFFQLKCASVHITRLTHNDHRVTFMKTYVTFQLLDAVC